jgi:hypothetical protein
MLASFAAGFSSEDSFTDMVDVRERKVVSVKIEGTHAAFIQKNEIQLTAEQTH